MFDFGMILVRFWEEFGRILVGFCDDFGRVWVGFRVSRCEVKSYEKLRFLKRPAGFAGFRVSRV